MSKVRFVSSFVAIGVVVACAALMPSPASSEAFPGENGRIAFSKPADDSYDVMHIWVMDNDGSNQEQITFGDVRDFSPMWSPDGTRMALQSTRSGTDQVWVMDADGSDMTELTSFEEGASLNGWSPDGTKILFSADPVPQTGDGNALFVMDADGSNQIQLTTDNDFDRWANFSPDGSQIVFTRTDPETTATEIWVVEADGSNAVQLTDSGISSTQSFEPMWSPDGSRITFIRRVGDPAEHSLWVMDADGSNAEEIFGPGASKPAWSPDGTLIAFVRFDDPFEGIWTIRPDGTDLTPIAFGLDTDPAWERLTGPTPTTTAAPTTSTTARASDATTTPRFTG